MPVYKSKNSSGGKLSSSIRYVLSNGKEKEQRERIELLPATGREGAIDEFKEGERFRVLSSTVPSKTPKEIIKNFKATINKRPDVKKPIKTASISFAEKDADKLTTRKILAITLDALKEMDALNCPLIIVQHRDKKHPHPHIVSSEIDFNGERISKPFERVRMRELMLKIEEKCAHARTPERAADKSLSRAEIERFKKAENSKQTGKSPPVAVKIPARIVAQNQMDKILRESKTFEQAIAKAEESGLKISGYFKKDELKGYRICAEGVWFKASSLGSAYTIKGAKEIYVTEYEHVRDDKAFARAGERAKQDDERKHGIGEAETQRRTGAVKERTTEIAYEQ